MNKNPLAGGEASAFEHVGPHGEERLGDGGGVNRIQSRRDRQTLRHGCDAILSVAAAGDECAHAGAVLADDRSRDFQPRYVGRAGRRWILSLTLHDVGAVHTGRFDLDEYLVWSWFGCRAFDDSKDVRPAGAGNLDCTHDVNDMVQWSS